MPVGIRFSRSFLYALALAAFVRVIVAIATVFVPIPNEAGLPTSVLHLAPSSDLPVYQHAQEAVYDSGFVSLVDAIADLYVGEPARHRQILAAPMFPALLSLFDYKEGHTLPLAAFYVVLGILVAALWLWWLDRQGLSQIWLLAFAILPHPLWFMINLGSDLVSALFVACIYLTFKNSVGIQRYAWSVLFVALMLLTRPTGVSLLIFVVVSMVFLDHELSARNRIILLVPYLIVFAPFLVFYLPYAAQFANSSSRLTYFGYTQSDYLAGVFDVLPHWLNLLASWLSLGAAKLLYLVGLRPTYGDAHWAIVLLRSAPGLLFLPGLVYLTVRGNVYDRWLTILFLLPVLAGASQDRYTLPLQPILFIYGLVAYRRLGQLVARRSPRPGETFRMSQFR